MTLSILGGANCFSTFENDDAKMMAGQSGVCVFIHQKKTYDPLLCDRYWRVFMMDDGTAKMPLIEKLFKYIIF